MRSERKKERRGKKEKERKKEKQNNIGKRMKVPALSSSNRDADAILHVSRTTHNGDPFT
jgi:hypothetical protein